ncbi:MerR family transcriptional regulator [Rhizobium sp.]|jgi:DNA-binding transcriptional MerR regulator|uniref:MerR family transcriptional regulator n=1 Tax=Rhizobium sp. TaxID=391 RepID=UPI000E8A191D|nr:LuxR family transcriptional regulator [Rhizobium sp.]
MRFHIEHPNSTPKAEAIPHVALVFLPNLPMPEDMPPEPIAISDMANLFGVTHRTLHFYEEKNLLSSSRMGLMRVYYHRDIRRMALINTCRETGMPIAAIQEFLTELAEVTSQAEANALLATALEERKRELIASQSTMLRQMRQINQLMAQYDDEEKEQDAKQLPDVHLSELEHQCLTLMAEGYTPIRLARTMQMSPEAVQSLEVGIMRKINASNRFQAVAKAVLLGLIAS